MVTYNGKVKLKTEIQVPLLLPAQNQIPQKHLVTYPLTKILSLEISPLVTAKVTKQIVYKDTVGPQHRTQGAIALFSIN